MTALQARGSLEVEKKTTQVFSSASDVAVTPQTDASDPRESKELCEAASEAELSSKPLGETETGLMLPQGQVTESAMVRNPRIIRVYRCRISREFKPSLHPTPTGQSLNKYLSALQICVHHEQLYCFHIIHRILNPYPKTKP